MYAYIQRYLYFYVHAIYLLITNSRRRVGPYTHALDKPGNSTRVNIENYWIKLLLFDLYRNICLLNIGERKVAGLKLMLRK